MCAQEHAQGARVGAFQSLGGVQLTPAPPSQHSTSQSPQENYRDAVVPVSPPEQRTPQRHDHFATTAPLPPDMSDYSPPVIVYSPSQQQPPVAASIQQRPHEQQRRHVEFMPASSSNRVVSFPSQSRLPPPLSELNDNMWSSGMYFEGTLLMLGANHVFITFSFWC
jgi:hypothetical protein